MTTRDRLVVMGIVLAALLAGVWFIAVAPEREKAATLSTQVSAASAQLQAAQSQLASARSAEAQYPAAYASIVSLGKAVPASEEVPSLLYQLAHLADAKDVEFGSITSGTGASPAASASTTAGFAQLPFTLTFTGTYSDLYRLFQALDSSAVQTAGGGIQISGRLLTINSIKLSPASSGPTSGTGDSEQVSGVIDATAYVLPASQGLTAGATASSPTGSAAPATTASSATTPAVVKVTP